MKDLIRYIIRDLERRGARYVDVRLSTLSTEAVKVRSGSVETLASGTERGIGIRAPCFARTCPYGHYRCLGEIAPGTVVETALRLLERPGAR